MVKKIVNAVKLLTREDLDELLSWLSDYELSQMDDWDKEIERDSEDYGRLQTTINRVRKDISEGRMKPIDKVLNNS